MGQTWAVFCKSRGDHWEMSCALAWHQASGLGTQLPSPGLTAPALPQQCRQAEHLHRLWLKDLRVTPQTQLPMCYRSAKTACGSRAGLSWKQKKSVHEKLFYLQHSLTRSIFIVALNCLHSKGTTDAAVSFSHHSNSFFIFLLFQHFAYFDVNILPYCFTFSLVLPQDLKVLWNYLSP